MKKLLILISCFTAILLTTSCTTESIEEEDISIVNEDTHPLPPPIENGDDDRDKDKVKG